MKLPFLVVVLVRCFAVLCFVHGAHAAAVQVDPETASAIKKEGLENSQAMAILDELTNGIGHRLTGSDNFTAACKWGKGKFESFGMTAVELEKWGTWPVTWNRGQWMGRVTAPVEMDLQVATVAWTNGTKGNQSGRVINAAKTEDLEAIAAEMDVAGSWVLTRAGRRGSVDRGLMAKGQELGVLGFLYSSSGDSSYPNRMRVFGSYPRSSDIPDSLPAIMIRRDQFEKLSGMVDAGEVTAEFDIRNRWRQEPIDLHNVVAEIPGTEFPDEVVVVCGHLDSWHMATGTTDNGTGTTSTLEAARILMAVGAKPKRTIRFCLWGGEEQGLIGSNRHVTMRRTQMPKVSAVFNHDTGTNWAHSLSVTDAMYDDMQTALAAVFDLEAPEQDWEEPVFNLRKTARMSGGGGSDHASFLRAGVPGWSWGLEGRSDYFRHTWHTQWDTYDVAIPEYMRHTSTVVALAALGTANLPNLLSREGVGRARGNDLKPRLEGLFGVSLGGKGDLEVTKVEADGRGATMGLAVGDKIQSVNGKAVKSLADMMSALRDGPGGEGEPRMTVEGGKTMKLPFGQGRRRRAPASADK